MPGCGLAPQFAYSACFHSPKADVLSPNWKFDPHRAHFCKKFGKDQPNICPEIPDPCESIHEPLRSLDYFSAPPMYRRNVCGARFRYQESLFPPEKCKPKCQLPPSSCPGIPQLPPCFCRPKPNPFSDVLCGLCQPNNNLENKNYQGQRCPSNENESSCPTSDDLPFTVHFTDPRSYEDPPVQKVNSQVERCIHTSSTRYLDTVYNLEHLDFYKTKSPEHVKLYRTQLAIEKRRPRLTIPLDSLEENKPIDMTQPIYITAKAIRMKNKGKGPIKTYQVCVPGPITLG